MVRAGRVRNERSTNKERARLTGEELEKNIVYKEISHYICHYAISYLSLLPFGLEISPLGTKSLTHSDG